jgi:hypothetical protein
MSELVPVNIGACACPGTPHPDGDVLYLKPKLGLAEGMAIKGVASEWLQLEPDERPSQHELTGHLGEVYLEQGVADWNLVGEDGKPLPLTREGLREQVLSDFVRAETAADTADGLYYEPILSPLIQRLRASLLAMQTNGSTSARNGRSTKPRKRSKQSSTTTSQTGVIAEISPPLVGVSSSSGS